MFDGMHPLSCNQANSTPKGFTAADAETGLQLLVREKPDLVVTDLHLPGMSGLEFLQAVKRANAALPVVVMTAYGTVESGRRSDESRRSMRQHEFNNQ
ncbi:MAG: response regulator [Terriglobales bacterium]